MHRSH